MNVQKRNDGVSVYRLSSGPTLPEWIGERARRNLSKRDESIRRRIELVQDFQMPASSSKIVQSADGRYVVAAGTYPPRIRCYDLHDLTMKFERYVDANVLDVVMLGEDYGKFALLQDDRTVAFHAPYGAHESVRIPTFGRAMSYEPTTCELLVAAKGSRLYRINLEEGRFSVPWTWTDDSSSSGSVDDVSATCITVNRAHPLAAVGCNDGMVRFWDSRVSDQLKPFLKLDVQSATVGYGYYDGDDNANSYNGTHPNEITSLAHDPSGLHMAVGTAGGIVTLFDVRSSRPLHIKEHKHGLPIHTVQFHSTSGLVLSSDDKLIKAWRYKSSSSSDIKAASNRASDGNDTLGSVMVNIEGTGKLTHFITAGDEKDPTGDQSGVLLCAADQPKMECYYVPALGTAPKWCSFLENITDELEERDMERDGGSSGAASDLVRDGSKETVYENYKFVSRDDVEKLGISNLVGTPLLRGYMHGFFIDSNLYNRVKAVANPFEYEEYRKKKLKERLEAKHASRIAPRPSDQRKASKNNAATVNPELAERLQDKVAGNSATTKAGKVANKLLSDSRFGSLFTNPDFQIDEDDEDFKLRNPSGVAAVKRRRNNMDSDDDEEEEEKDGKDSDSDDNNDSQHPSYIRQDASSGILESNEGQSEGDSSSDSDSDDEDGFIGGKVRGEAYETMKAISRGMRSSEPSLVPGNKKTIKKKKVTMYEAEELDGKNAAKLGLGSDEASKQARQRLDEMSVPLSKRVAAKRQQEDAMRVRVNESGSKEATFIPRDVREKMAKEQESKRRAGSRDRDEKGKRKRRGVKELGFKTPFKHL